MLPGASLASLKQAGRERAKDKPANVCHVSNTAALDSRDGPDLVQQLGEKPDPDQHQCGHKRHPRKVPEQQHRANPVAGVGDQECAHHGGDGATGRCMADLRLLPGHFTLCSRLLTFHYLRLNRW
jgi:hypothetical protein